MVVWIILYFQPYLRKISILTNIFQVGWFNHQLVIFKADLLLSQWFGLVIKLDEIVRADVRTLETQRNDTIVGVLAEHAGPRWAQDTVMNGVIDKPYK